MPEHIEVFNLNSNNTAEFLARLRLELFAKFEVSRDEDLPENYSRAKNWSLLRMIENDQLDIYQLLYINGDFWGGSGGIIRHGKDGAKIYQAGFRTFSKSLNVRRSLGMKPYISAYCIRHQLERAKENDCDQIVLSFNLHNKRLFDLVRRYHHQRSFGGVQEMMKDFVPSSKPVLFNGVHQWLLEIKLK